MNAVDSEHLAYPPDRALWEQPELQPVLAARDVTRMYRLLQKNGYSPSETLGVQLVTLP
jgi:hypothetical protein